MKTDAIKKTLYETFGHLPDDQLLALTIWGEARGEKEQGRIAVGSVILERVKKQSWMGKTIKEVCLMPYQFSCYLPSDPNRKKMESLANAREDVAGSMPDSFLECLSLARGLINGEIPENKLIQANGVTHYKTLDCSASWEKEMHKVVTIGNHDFYRPTP